MMDGSSHKLCALALTEAIIHSTKNLKIPVVHVYLDKEAAFDCTQRTYCEKPSLLPATSHHNPSYTSLTDYHLGRLFSNTKPLSWVPSMMGGGLNRVASHPANSFSSGSLLAEVILHIKQLSLLRMVAHLVNSNPLYTIAYRNLTNKVSAFWFHTLRSTAARYSLLDPLHILMVPPHKTKIYSSNIGVNVICCLDPETPNKK